jgi:hypothetical protein
MLILHFSEQNFLLVLQLPTPPSKERIDVIMNVPNNQEVYVHFSKYKLVHEELAKAKHITVFIVPTGIIKMDVKNWWKKNYWDRRF